GFGPPNEGNLLAVGGPTRIALGNGIAREPAHLRRVHELHVQVVVVFPLAVPDKRDLLPIRRKGWIDLGTPEIGKWDDSQRCGLCLMWRSQPPRRQAREDDQWTGNGRAAHQSPRWTVRRPTSR